ncbi:ROK family protein [Spirilliplanes yamanashiensis]|uniref:Sugar kinase n=1 Tax=Spirilliplanes yamanashiensis TaxID=42233 RepID=A0A8J4DLQ6_9ACTN|nr:ROK family protein [Spirilliplanes yamanashiensis]MDP9819034.1 putative NBD/HSP70 family sugar kinase [Spirilliplanes yamanashiensis]GIJ05489.1 sugar kinase [Spirilliplanes yamanashiensis]
MEAKKTTVRDIRRRNRSILLSRLFFEGPLSRLELSGMTGLSAATASNVTAELIDERLVVEAGQVESDGGRPRVLLRVDPDYGYVVGVELAETGIRAELFDLSMTRRATVEEPMPPAPFDPGAVADHIAKALAAIVPAAGVAPAKVLAAGIGVPGTVDHESSAVVHAPTVGWDAVRLEQLLRDRGVELPLYVENGAKTQGQAEMWFGSGRGARHAVIVLVGSGVGAALVNNGAILRGISSSAGEWGHTTCVYGGRPCRCGARGCLEAYVGADAILDRFAELGTGLTLDGDADARIRAIVAAAADDPAVAAFVDEVAGMLGDGIANLVNLLNPERVVLGGFTGLALGERLLPRIRAAAQAGALPHPFGQATIELAKLGPDAIAFGAATLPVADLLARGADPRESAAAFTYVDA